MGERRREVGHCDSDITTCRFGDAYRKNQVIHFIGIECGKRPYVK
jgi:hypothetical protein